MNSFECVNARSNGFITYGLLQQTNLMNIPGLWKSFLSYLDSPLDLKVYCFIILGFTLRFSLCISFQWNLVYLETPRLQKFTKRVYDKEEKSATAMFNQSKNVLRSENVWEYSVSFLNKKQKFNPQQFLQIIASGFKSGRQFQTL